MIKPKTKAMITIVNPKVGNRIGKTYSPIPTISKMMMINPMGKIILRITIKRTRLRTLSLKQITLRA